MDKATFLPKYFFEIVIFVISVLDSVFLTTFKKEILKKIFSNPVTGGGRLRRRKPEGDFNKNDHAMFVVRTDPSMNI